MQNQGTESVAFLQEKLLTELNAVGIALKKEPNSEHLRKIKRLLWDYECTDKYSDDVRYLIFYLNIYIDKVLLNLTGSVPDIAQTTKETQDQFFRNMGCTFCKLSAALRLGNSESEGLFFYLGIIYLDTVETLNRNINEVYT